MNDLPTLLSLPAWPPRPGPALYVTLAIVAAALAGELAQRRFRQPRIVGYVLTGLVCSIVGLGLPIAGVQGIPRLVVQTALGVLLFEVGTSVSLRWLLRNKALALTGLAETILSALAVAAVLAWVVALPWPMALAAAIVLAAGAPSIVGRVAQELRAGGQVTERVLTLSALGTLLAILALTLLTGALHAQLQGRWLKAGALTLYAFAGAVLLAIALALAMRLVVRTLDLRAENGVLLALALIVLAQVVATMFGLSPLLVPLLAGVVLRNSTERPWLWPRHFGTAGGVLVLLMFMAIGAMATLADLAAGLLAALLVLAVRALVKAGVVHALAGPSGLDQRKAVSVWMALVPVAATSAAMLMELYREHPEVAGPITPVVLSAVAVMTLAGPILVQLALERAGDVDDGHQTPSVPAPMPDVPDVLDVRDASDVPATPAVPAVRDVAVAPDAPAVRAPGA